MATNTVDPTNPAPASGADVTRAGAVQGADPASGSSFTGGSDAPVQVGPILQGPAPVPLPIVGPIVQGQGPAPIQGPIQPGPGPILPPLQPGPGPIFPPVEPVQGPEGGKIDIVPDTLKATLINSPIPGRPSSLNVTVDANVEVGWEVKLISATPQGINPAVKLLRFHVRQPTGAQSDAIFRKTFSYQESPAQADYTEVTLENEGDDVTVNVAVPLLP
jgi:hypothetical protein